MKKWLILTLSLLVVNVIGLSVFSLKSAPAQAGVSVTARVSAICGNDKAELEEVCDRSDLRGKKCQDFGYTAGNLACSPACDAFVITGCYTPPAPAPSPGAAPAPTETRVIIQGKAYPSAKITVLKDGTVAAFVTADSLANFKAEITNITAGVWSFGLWAEDKEGRRSITFSFTVTVTSGMTTTISGIFFPPTIELDKINVLRGETLKILGQTAPESEISIHIESPQEIVKKTTAQKTGVWSHLFDTSPLAEGSHTTRAKAETPEGLLSSYSKVLAFYVGKYGIAEISPKADFNKDGKTNLVDFSVMLYWWGKYNPAVDMNQDGIVNLPDFSILMYWWTG